MDIAARVSSKGRITIPKLAREASGLVVGDRVLVFVEREMGQSLLTHEPLADDLIDLAAQAARKKRGVVTP